LPQQRLVLEIEAATVRALAESGIAMVIARPGGLAAPNLTWLALPAAASCTITWEPTYGLYAANVPGRAGARIDVIASIHPVTDQTLCRFAGGEFRQAAPGAKIPRRHYDVENASPSAAAFGLLQRADVDGMAVLSPVNAVVVPPRHRADFTAVDDVFVWLQQDAAGGVVIAGAPASATKIAFGPKDAVRHHRFDLSTSTFIPSAPASRRRLPWRTAESEELP
jgi:hypothetical protein